MWPYIIHSVLSYSSPKERKTGERARESGPGNEVAMYKEIIPQPSPTRVATFPSDYVYVLWYLL